MWLEVELGTLNGDGIQVDVTESAVQPGPGLRCHLSDLQIYFENWPDAQLCTHTHTHTLGDVIHIYQGREEATSLGKKIIVLIHKWDKFTCKGSTKYKELSLFTSSYSNAPISAFKAVSLSHGTIQATEI